MRTDPAALTARPLEQWVHLDGEDNDRRIDAFELSSARRALALLKSRLGCARLLELLQDEIAAGDAFLRDHLARSNGQEATGTNVLRAHGITAGQFGGWLGQAFARLDVMLARHPEHYSIHTAPGKNVNIVETLGDQVCPSICRDGITASTRSSSPRRPRQAPRPYVGPG